MHLKALTLINWGTYEPRTFEFQGTTLITGANGSGKSMFSLTPYRLCSRPLTRTSCATTSPKPRMPRAIATRPTARCRAMH